MTRIAHLSDLHLLEERHAARRGVDALRLAYLSFGRSTDAARRKRRAARALEEALRTDADHLVLTGDLTEDGVDAQFEVLAEVLAESGWAPERVTLVPGNHDYYAEQGAWARALAGPLRAYAETSTGGRPLAIGGAVLVPISTACYQPFTRSAGAIAREHLEAAERAARETRRSGRAVILAQHHPPRPHPFPPMQWIDGLAQHAEIMAVLREHDHVHLVHGHTHVRRHAPVRSGAADRIFSTEAAVHGAAPVAVYEAKHGRVLAAADPVPVPALRLAVA